METEATRPQNSEVAHRAHEPSLLDQLISYFRLKSVRLILLGTLIILALLSPPSDFVADSNLTVHMFQHFGIFSGGIIFGYGIEKFLVTKLVALRKRFYFGFRVYGIITRMNLKTKGIIFAALIPALVFGYWHVPGNFNLAVANETVHVLEHLLYIVSGSLVGLSIVAIPEKWRGGLLGIGFMQAGMMGSMWVLSPTYFSLYSAAQNEQMATALMLFGAIGLLASSGYLLKALDII